MNDHFNPQEQDNIAKARESFSGRLLTDSQFDEAIAITGIMEREIKKSGSFKQKLGDYAYTFARNEKFDVLKAEETVRDLFKARTGKTMNQMRESFLEREKKLLEKQNKKTLSKADQKTITHATEGVGEMIRQGDKIPFYRAYAHQAAELANNLEITDAAAKTLMKNQFKQTDERDLYEWGKELETEYYQPQIDAEKEAREKVQGVEASPESATTRSRKR